MMAHTDIVMTLKNLKGTSLDEEILFKTLEEIQLNEEEYNEEIRRQKWGH
jgi:hypothetical protein